MGRTTTLEGSTTVLGMATSCWPVAIETWNGVAFQNPDACTECHACEKVCPMDLQPRTLDAEESRSGVGFYPNGMTNHALCIRCGDCVAACEATTDGEEVAPLGMGWLGEPDKRRQRA